MATRFGARWDAIIAATTALKATPVRFGEAEGAQLRGARLGRVDSVSIGLDELELLDVIQAGAFVNWANLMLSLGEPTE